MSHGDVFTEAVSRIPAVDRTQVEDTDDRTYSELLELVPEIHQLELDNAFAEASGGATEELDVLCWNGERGRFVLEETPLPSADIYLLNEMDVGMARTENAHTVRRSAERLGGERLNAGASCMSQKDHDPPTDPQQNFRLLRERYCQVEVAPATPVPGSGVFLSRYTAHVTASQVRKARPRSSRL